MIRIACLSLALSTLLAAAPLMARPVTVTLESVEAEDGDTLVVELDGQTERVQLAGIDAPEDTDNAKLQRDMARTGLDAATLQALGRAATAHLRELVAGGGPFALTYDPGQRDRYGRLTAEVSGAGSGSLNEAMLTDGYAMVLAAPGGAAPPNADAWSALEREAIEQGRGLWGTDRDLTLAWSGRASD